MDRLIDYSINHPLLAGGLVFMALVVLAFELRQRGALSASVGPSEAIRLMNEGAALVDIRSANQFKDGHIQGAKNIPGDQVAADPKGIAKLAPRTIILYCDSGTTTAAAQRTLAAAGIRDVRILRGGLAGWKQENLPVTQG